MSAVCIFKKVEKIIEKEVEKIIEIEFFNKKYKDEYNKNNREEIEAFYEQSKDSLLFITQKAVA